MTELYSLIAATAAKRFGLVPTFTHLDSTSFHVDGRYNSDAAPPEQVIHVTRGSSRDHRPDLNQVMLDLMVEHQAGIPGLMQPLRGNSHDATDFGQGVRAPLAQIHIPSGTTYVVADSALYSQDNLQTLADTGTKWITRVPATLTEVPQALPQANPETMSPLQEGYRYAAGASSYGGVAQRGLVIYSAHRQPQAQRTVNKRWLTSSEPAAKALKKLCRTPFACEAAAKQAVETFAPGLQSTYLPQVTLQPTPRYGKRGRPKPGAPPRVAYHIDGALASAVSARQQRVRQQSCFILATNALDAHALSPQAVLEGYKGQKHADRGFRFLKGPPFLASSLYLKKPERLMALLMVMTVSLLGYAALEYRIRQALKAHGATFPDQKGQRIQHPTARWVFHYFVGIHVLFLPDQWPIVINLTDEHPHLLQLLGDRSAWFYR